MAEKVGDGFVELSTRDAQFRRGMMNAESSLKNFGKLAAATGVIVAGVLVARAAVKAGVDMTQSYAKQEKAELGLSGALGETRSALQQLMKGFKAAAREIQSKTLISEEEILNAMAYGKNLGITTEKLNTTTIAAVGLSRTMEIGLKPAMGKIAKAQAEYNAEVLKYGRNSQQAQDAQMKLETLVKRGAEAFRLAEYEVKGITGAQDKLKIAFNSLKKPIGGAIADMLDLEKNTVKVTDALGAMAKKLTEMREAGTFREIGQEMIEGFAILGRFVDRLSMAEGLGKALLAAEKEKQAFFKKRERGRALAAELKGWLAEGQAIEKADKAAAAATHTFQGQRNAQTAIVEGEKEIQEEKRRTASLLGGFSEISRRAQEAALSAPRGPTVASIIGQRPTMGANTGSFGSNAGEELRLFKQMAKSLLKIENKEEPQPVFG